MELIELKTNIRTSVGNGPARTLRRAGRVPAVLYGPGKATLSLSIEKSELEKILRKKKAGHLLLNLVIENGQKENRTAMIKELQTHPATRKLLHVDFYEISMDRQIRVNVPVITTGKAKGVEAGGILQIARREIEVLCLPGIIPDAFEVDISDLDVGDAIHAEDLPRPAGVELPDDVNFTVLSVVSPTREVVAEEEIEGEAAEGEAAAEGEEESEEDSEG